MTVPAGWYADPHEPERLRWWDGAAWTTHVQPSAPAAAAPAPVERPHAVLAREVEGLEAQIARLTRARDELQVELVETRDVMLLQEIGVYEYAHPLDSSVEYRGALEALEAEMAAKVKAGAAVSGTKKWAINGSEKEGARMVTDFSKLMLRAYNNEADSIVRTLRWYAREAAIARLQKIRAAIAKLGVSMKIEILAGYHALRVKEIELTADFLAKLADEKDRAREERARLREEAIARREYEAEQARLEKERAHYQAVLRAMIANGDPTEAAAARRKLGEIDQAIARVIDRAANARAGYVYVISNVGSFGKDVVKIGLTRRLKPEERVRELSGASVPFGFDIHALFFHDDAVGLETRLHRRFASQRVNLINLRREFFYVTPQVVKVAVVEELGGKLLSFVDQAEALQWRQSTNARLGGAAALSAAGDDDDDEVDELEEVDEVDEVD